MFKKQKNLKMRNNRKGNEMNNDKKQSMLGVAWSVFLFLLLLIIDIAKTAFSWFLYLAGCVALWLFTKFIGWLREPAQQPPEGNTTHTNETRVDNKERVRSTAKQMQEAYDLEFATSVALLNEKTKKEQLELDMLAKQKVSDLQLVHWKEFMEQLDKIKKDSLATNLVKQPAPALQPANPVESQPGNEKSWWENILPDTAKGQEELLQTIAIGGLVILGGSLILGPAGALTALAI